MKTLLKVFLAALAIMVASAAVSFAVPAIGSHPSGRPVTFPGENHVPDGVGPLWPAAG